MAWSRKPERIVKSKVNWKKRNQVNRLHLVMIFLMIAICISAAAGLRSKDKALHTPQIPSMSPLRQGHFRHTLGSFCFSIPDLLTFCSPFCRDRTGAETFL